MRRALLTLLFLVLASSSAEAVLVRRGPAMSVSEAPAGECKTFEVYTVNGESSGDKGEHYCCVGWTPGGAAGTWTQCDVGAGGGGGGDDVTIDGGAATNPDLRDSTHTTFTLCTGVGAPHADCLAADDVLVHIVEADLVDLMDGTLTGSKVGSGINDDNVDFDDADSNFTATTIGSAIEELDDVINGGLPNAATGKVDWSQNVNVPATIADGVDGGDELRVNAAATTTPNLADTAYSKFLLCVGSEDPDPECANPNEIIGWAEDMFAPSVGAGQLMFESPTTTGVDGHPHLHYTEPSGSVGGKVNLDVGNEITLDTMARWRTQQLWKFDDDFGPNGAAYSRTAFCSDINLGNCAGGSRAGLPCQVNGDCPSSTCTGPTDPLGNCDWVKIDGFNLSESGPGLVADNTMYARDHSWENVYFDGTDYFTEDISHYFADDGVSSGLGTGTIFWHDAFRINGKCDAGSRAGLICFPGGGPDNSATGANWGCPSGTCIEHGNGIFTTNAGSWGYCTSSPKTLCQTNAQCPSSDCQRTELNGAFWQLKSDYANKAQNYFSTDRLLVVAPDDWLFAGDIPVGGRVASSITFTVAPQAADTDGSAYGQFITATMGPHTEATGQLGTLAGQYLKVDVNPDDNNSDVGLVSPFILDVVIRPTGDSGTIGTAGSDNSIIEVIGADIMANFASAIDADVIVWDGIRIKRPISGSSDSRVRNFNAFQIEDTCPATGASNWGNPSLGGNTSIRVEPNTCSSARKGNIQMGDDSGVGGNWNNGHIRLGWGDLWFDDTNNDFRVLGADSPTGPTSETDGAQIVRGECGTVSVDPPSIGAASTGAATATITLTSGTNLPCSCYAQTDFDDDLITKGCGFSGTTLTQRLYNPTGTPIDALAQTVAYCCYEN